MTDIVEKLRDPSKGSPRWGDTMAEAADEIERLRAERDRLREALRLADAALSGANMNMNAVEKKVRAALGESDA